MSLVAIKRRAEGVKYEGDTFEKLDLRSLKAFGSTWTKCHFIECNMDLADLRSSRFTDCTFHHSSFRLANLAVSFFDGCSFVSCDMEQASLMGCHLTDCYFSQCRMTYADTLFQDATVKTKMLLIGCNLHGSSLDFREVEPGALKFDQCNLWGAKMSMGCAFWNGSFDERLVRQFLALVARVSQDERLKDLAGDQYGVVCRAMDGRKGPGATLVPVLAGMEG